MKGFDQGQQYRRDRSSASGLPVQSQRSEIEENGARIPEFLRQRQQQATDPT